MGCKNQCKNSKRLSSNACFYQHYTVSVSGGRVSDLFGLANVLVKYSKLINFLCHIVDYQVNKKFKLSLPETCTDVFGNFLNKISLTAFGNNYPIFCKYSLYTNQSVSVHRHSSESMRQNNIFILSK